MRQIILFVLLSFFPTSLSFAETIILKSGKTIDARIVERADKSIKVDFYGVPLTYYLEDIESIDGKIIHSPTEPSLYTPYQKKPEDIFANVSPAIVYIATKTPQGEEYLGSGFIVGSNGVIATNYHVIYSAKQINVRLKNGDIYPVTGVIYHDVIRDVCILKIDANNLPIVTLGDAHDLKIGETVYCIGNPLGLEYSFSDGMLSGMRDQKGAKWLQFTAPISPGNSGGPLLNSRGEAVGVVTFLMLGGQNLNFALGINEIRPYIRNSISMSIDKFANLSSEATNYVKKALEFLAQKDYENAGKYCWKALELDPRNVTALLMAATAYYDIGSYREAALYYQKVLEIDPNQVFAYEALGDILFHEERFQEALQYYQRGIELDPYNVHIWSYIGDIYNRSRNDDKALYSYHKAIEINKNDFRSLVGLSDIYRTKGDWGKSKDFGKRAISVEPNRCEGYLTLGFTYRVAGQEAESSMMFEKVREVGDDACQAKILIYE